MALKKFDKGAPGTAMPANDRAWVCRWADLGSDDEGSLADLGGWDRASVQVFGTFSGASLSIEGSHDGENFAVLSDPQGLPLSLTAADLKAVTEPCRYIKPKVNGGDEETKLTVIVLARRS
jgi:hypothetical protein